VWKICVALSAVSFAVVPLASRAEPPAQSGRASSSTAPGVGGVREISGTVVNTMSVTGYTYVQIDTGEEVVWAAAPRTEVQVADEVVVAGAAPISGFYSSTLDRRFEMVYFAPILRVTSGERAATPSLAEHRPPEPVGADEIDLTGIERPDGGQTIGEIFASKDRLAGEEVTLRGRVVKCATGILGRNWIHLRDGTAGPAGGGDLAVTTDAVAEVGSTILVRGTVVIDKDFGYGYRYDLLIEDASVTVE
jgi:hypothetical protein